MSVPHMQMQIPRDLRSLVMTIVKCIDGFAALTMTSG
jgi:hypothetical protein